MVNKVIAIGRRKSSIAKIELIPGNGLFKINDKFGRDYMQDSSSLIMEMEAPLNFLKLKNKIDIYVNVKGGGLIGQAHAIKLGIARALCILQDNYRPSLKLKGFLTRDARVRERKKYGLKKARKAPQFSKR